MRLFERDESDAVSTEKCCDICESVIVETQNRSAELKLLVTTIDELGNRGEVYKGDRVG